MTTTTRAPIRIRCFEPEAFSPGGGVPAAETGTCFAGGKGDCCRELATGAGAGFDGGDGTGCTGAPQDSQNFTPGAIGAPHWLQPGAASFFAPQISQNFVPGESGLPQLRQVRASGTGEFCVMMSSTEEW